MRSRLIDHMASAYLARYVGKQARVWMLTMSCYVHSWRPSILVRHSPLSNDIEERSISSRADQKIGTVVAIGQPQERQDYYIKIARL
jgi:hypothetical protein